MIRLQFITHHNERYSYLESAKMALDGGCRWIQLRMKGATKEEVVRTAEQIALMCCAKGAKFILDDHAEWVREVGADGVHLGKRDMPIAEARKLLGREKIIGATANTFEDVEAHFKAGADYIGCGPFRFTTTKEGLSPILGLEGYQQIVNKMRQVGINLPIVAIGGIGYDDIDPLMECGLTGIALSGSILQAERPSEEMRRVVNKLYSE